MVKIFKLKDKKIIKKLINNGFIYKTRKYKFFYLQNDNNFSYAISISKRLGKSNVRNKEKRWVRSIIDQNRSFFKNGGYAFIVIKESGGLFLEASNEITSFISKNY